MSPESKIQHELARLANEKFGKEAPGDITTKDIARLPTEQWRLKSFEGPPMGWREFVEVLTPDQLTMLQSLQYQLDRSSVSFSVTEIRTGIARGIRRSRSRISTASFEFLENTFSLPKR